MAAIPIFIPPALEARMLAAYSNKLRKTATIDDVKATLSQDIKNTVRDYEIRIAEGYFKTSTQSKIEDELGGIA